MLFSTKQMTNITNITFTLNIVKDIVKEVFNMLNDILHRHFQVTLKFLNPSADIHECSVAENKAQPSNFKICDTVKKNQMTITLTHQVLFMQPR